MDLRFDQTSPYFVCEHPPSERSGPVPGQNYGEKNRAQNCLTVSNWMMYLSCPKIKSSPLSILHKNSGNFNTFRMIF